MSAVTLLHTLLLAHLETDLSVYFLLYKVTLCLQFVNQNRRPERPLFPFFRLD